jgi:Fe-S cluster assembly protein SufD
LASAAPIASALEPSRAPGRPRASAGVASDRCISDSRPPLSEEATLALSERLGEAPALGAFRLAGLHQYLEAPLPERSSHRWRYTDPRSLLPPRIDLPQELRPAPRALELPNAAVVVRLDSGAQPSIHLSKQAEIVGVDARSLSDPDADSDGLGTAVSPERGLFEALNAAAWSSGVVIRVPRGCALLEPIHVMVPVSSRLSVPRVLVALGDGADATVIERHVGGAPGQQVVGVTELFGGRGSELRYVLSQEWSPGVRGHLTSRLELQREARALTVLHSFGGEQLKLDLGAKLVGEGAHSEIVGFALAGSGQHLDHRTEHRHRAPHTWSNIDLKLVLAEQARTAATGLIRIEEEAAQSEAYQELRNLLLSPDCRADAIPELEIMTNEVQCSHGATSSPVDAEHLFYLRSRGIPPADALRMVVRGFFETAIARLPAAMAESVARSVNERLARVDLAGPQEGS